jgi:hypothetical protein
MAINMGMGKLGSEDIVFKRKFRWTMSLNWNNKNIDEYFVKVASRPSLTVEEQEINFLNGKMWIPGKGSWETMEITFYDVGGAAGTSMSTLYSWLATVYNFTDAVGLQQSSSARGYGATGTLRLYDGCGETMEKWTLKKMWPTAVNFGDLDYSNNEEVNITLTVRFSEVEYDSFCPDLNIDPKCVGCNTFGGASESYGQIGQRSV